MKLSFFFFACFLCLQHISFSQTFEGTVTMDGISNHVAKHSLLTVRGNKSMMEVRLDSSESIKIIKDIDGQKSTLLKNKNGLKYGFTTFYTPDPFMSKDNLAKEITGVTKSSETHQEKIGRYLCTKYTFTNATGKADVYISKEPGIPLSHFYPEFYKSNIDSGLDPLRIAADLEGTIIQYTESVNNSTLENAYTFIIEPKPVSEDVFNFNGEYKIVDAEGMKQLYSSSVHDEVAKKQWNEFMQLFGH